MATPQAPSVPARLNERPTSRCLSTSLRVASILIMTPLPTFAVSFRTERPLCAHPLVRPRNGGADLGKHQSGRTRQSTLMPPKARAVSDKRLLELDSQLRTEASKHVVRPHRARRADGDPQGLGIAFNGLSPRTAGELGQGESWLRSPGPGTPRSRADSLRRHRMRAGSQISPDGVQPPCSSPHATDPWAPRQGPGQFSSHPASRLMKNSHHDGFDSA